MVFDVDKRNRNCHEYIEKLFFLKRKICEYGIM